MNDTIITLKRAITLEAPKLPGSQPSSRPIRTKVLRGTCVSADAYERHVRVYQAMDNNHWVDVGTWSGQYSALYEESRFAELRALGDRERVDPVDVRVRADNVDAVVGDVDAALPLSEQLDAAGYRPANESEL